MSKRTNEISKKQYALFVFLGLFSFFATWSVLSYSGLIKPFFLPSPSKVFSAIYRLFVSGELVSDIFISIGRILLGFLVSLIVSLPLGIWLGISKRIEALCEPVIAFVRYIPPSAFVPLMIIWFGVGELEKVALLFLGIAPYLTLLIMDYIKNTRRDLIEVSRTLGANHWQVIRKVILPGAMPGIWDSFRIMIGAAWTFVIIAEIIGASSGLGFIIIQSQRYLRTDNIFGVIIIIGVLGIITDYAFKWSYLKMFKWTEKARN